jgi:hypothetical protein
MLTDVIHLEAPCVVGRLVVATFTIAAAAGGAIARPVTRITALVAVPAPAAPAPAAAPATGPGSAAASAAAADAVFTFPLQPLLLQPLPRGLR